MPTRRIIFIDPVCSRPYTASTLRREGLGETEATVTRVATGLSRRFRVTVAQHCREHGATEGGVDYVRFRHKRSAHGWRDVDVIVVVDAYKLLPRLRRHFPRARLFLWMHAFAGRKRKDIGLVASRADATIVTVSDHHAETVARHIQDHTPEHAGRVPVVTAYAPVDDALVPEDSRVDPDKLLFLGVGAGSLEQIVRNFLFVRERIPSMRLHVAHPGGVRPQSLVDLGVHVLGTLPRPDIVAHLRDALCLFHPQSVHADPLGLAFAEANAVGTPVLAHPTGAAAEILDASAVQLVDAGDPRQTVDRLLRWRQEGRPRVQLPERFRASRVVDQWTELIRPRPALAVGA